MNSIEIINKIKFFVKEKNNKDFHNFIFSLKEIDQKLATEIFWIIYDYTNCFKNSNVTAEIFDISWKLMEFWVIQHEYILSKNKKDIFQIKLFWKILKEIKFYKDWKINWAIIKNNIIQEYQKNIFISKKNWCSKLVKDEMITTKDFRNEKKLNLDLIEFNIKSIVNDIFITVWWVELSFLILELDMENNNKFQIFLWSKYYNFPKIDLIKKELQVDNEGYFFCKSIDIVLQKIIDL